MKMSDLKANSGFPIDIDRSKMVVVQVADGGPENFYSTILYTSKKTKRQKCEHFYIEPETFESKIYVINPK